MSRAHATVVFGLLGTQLDAGRGSKRWERWRPSVALFQHPDLAIARFELIHDPRDAELAERIVADIGQVSPETLVVPNARRFADPWDFEEVYGALHDFARGYLFRPEEEDYLVHISTGTHVAQICLFLLTESRHLPGRLIQTAPSKSRSEVAGSYTVVDLDLSRYDRLAARFDRERREGLSFLKSGIDTKNAAFNRLIERIEQVAIASRAPLLILGPTGAGKSHLARRVFELKRSRNQVLGAFVEVNCATLVGDGAMSALFGHLKGAFTGAAADRAGLLRQADGGVLFLDEIGELGPDEQAMLLRAVEERAFYPVGADREVRSDFQLIAGTNRDLGRAVREGRFREDLLARLNLWTFRLPALADRPEDLPPNLEYELEACAERVGRRISISKEARARFLGFAASREARWPANFRDFSAAVLRMATLAPGGRIGVREVDEEIERLRAAWAERFGALADGSGSGSGSGDGDGDGARDEPDLSELERALGPVNAAALDRFDRPQLAEVIRVCRSASSLSEAGRLLFEESRKKRSSVNDADRLRKYLARYGLRFDAL
jgi:transcriptional regulatory protein RtcR